MNIKLHLLFVSFVISTVSVLASYQRDYTGAYHDCEKLKRELERCETKKRFNKALKRACHLRKDCEEFQESFEDNELARQYNKCVVEACYRHLKNCGWRSKRVPQRLETSNAEYELDVKSVESIASSPVSSDSCAEASDLLFARSHSHVWLYEPSDAAAQSE